MTPEETVMLARYAKALFPNQHFDEYTPDAWHDVLHRRSLDDCRKACIAIQSRQPFMSAGEIDAEVRRIRNERLSRVKMPEPPPEIGTAREYLAWVRQTTRAIADGEYEPAAIEGTRRLDQKSIENTFRRVPADHTPRPPRRLTPTTEENP